MAGLLRIGVDRDHLGRLGRLSRLVVTGYGCRLLLGVLGCKIARNTDPLRGDIASNCDPS